MCAVTVFVCVYDDILGCLGADADTSGLLAEMTMASAAGDPVTETGPTDDQDMDDSAEELLTPPAQQQAALTPASQVASHPHLTLKPCVSSEHLWVAETS